MITLEDVEQASGRIAGRVLRTPMIYSHAISKVTGAEVVLKLDHLQVTGAFKERGAANRLAMLSEEERARGVIAMSAGNHAQAVARHANLLGIAATIVMPKFTPATKVTRTASWGANVVLEGESLAESAAHAHALAAAQGLVFIHPYDDPGIIAGQGTMALEMLQDAPDLDALIIPTGGGGLLAGCLVAASALKPGIAVFGAEVETYPAMAQRL
ncbi:MAG TPA: pyridoxal-phosphate dependent enzyme, partial [Rhodopila sp.]|nr:pyridoxal-phosphate dependent enzyme [Rhodopila sp.]